MDIFNNNYIYLYYANYASQQGLLNLKLVKDVLLAEQRKEMRKREKSTLKAVSPEVQEKAWKSLDAMLNLNTENLSNKFPQFEMPTRQELPQNVQIGGGNYRVTQVPTLRRLFQESTTLAEDLGNFGKSIDQILTLADARFNDDGFKQALEAAIVKDMSEFRVRKSMNSRAYSAAVRRLLSQNGNFIEVNDTNYGVIDRNILQLYALAEMLKSAPGQYAGGLKQLRGYGDKDRTFLDTIFSKVKGWQNNLFTTSGELAFAAAAVKAEITLGDLILKSNQEAKEALTGKGTGDFFEDPGFVQEQLALKNGFLPQTVNKQDVTVSYSNDKVVARWGFTVKTSRGKDRTYTKKLFTKLQDNTSLRRVIATTGLKNYPNFLPELVATAAGLPSGSRLGKYSPELKESNAKIDQRWMEMKRTIGAAMALNALSGYGGPNDRAVFFVWNDRIIPIRQILEKIHTSSTLGDGRTFIQIKNIKDRKYYTAMNQPVDKKGGPSWESAQVRSEKAKQIISQLENAKLTFILAFYLQDF